MTTECMRNTLAVRLLDIQGWNVCGGCLGSGRSLARAGPVTQKSWSSSRGKLPTNLSGLKGMIIEARYVHEAVAGQTGGGHTV